MQQPQSQIRIKVQKQHVDTISIIKLKVDTLWKHDTIIVPSPSLTMWDTVLKTQYDTIKRRSIIPIPIPIPLKKDCPTTIQQAGIPISSTPEPTVMQLESIGLGIFIGYLIFKRRRT